MGGAGGAAGELSFSSNLLLKQLTEIFKNFGFFPPFFQRKVAETSNNEVEGLHPGLQGGFYFCEMLFCNNFSESGEKLKTT